MRRRDVSQVWGGEFVGHGAEIPFVFGAQANRAGCADCPWFWILDDGEAALAATVADYWVSFALAGDPNAAHSNIIGGRKPAPAVYWPQYTYRGWPSDEPGVDGDEVRSEMPPPILDRKCSNVCAKTGLG